MFTSLTVFAFAALQTEIVYEYIDNDFFFQTCFNRHILASEPIFITIVLLSLGYPTGYILPACFVGIVYVVSGTLPEILQDMK